jgi:peptidoglycan lytic transglycosylase
MKTTIGRAESNGGARLLAEAEQDERVRLTSMRRVLVMASLAGCLSGCATHKPAVAPTTAKSAILESRVGLASYYGRDFHGQITASGARFDMNALVAAHPSYPFGTRVRVTNLANNRSTVVRIIDRGPAPHLRADGLLIDVSRKAAETLGFIQQGRTRVRLEVLAWGSR